MSKSSNDWYLEAVRLNPDETAALDWLAQQCAKFHAYCKSRGELIVALSESENSVMRKNAELITALKQARADRDHNEQVIVRLQQELADLRESFDRYQEYAMAAELRRNRAGM